MKTLKLYIVRISILFLSVGYVPAQELLTAEDAVKIALENNYDIRLAKNVQEINQLGVSPGFAGMLPQVNAVTEKNNSVQSIDQTRSDGTVRSLDNAKNNSLNYGLALDWTVFDGLHMFASYDRLKELEKLGAAELNNTIITGISEVLITYYNLVQQQQQLAVLDSTLVLSQQRVELAENRFTIGKASKLEVLNAQVDFNTDQTQLLNQQELFINTKTELNRLLARDSKTEFSITDAITVDNQLFLPNLEASAKEGNPQLQMQQISKTIAELELKQTKALRYPTIVASTGYNFSDSQSSLGFTTSNSAHGWNYGFRVSLNVFDGFNQNRNEKMAKIRVNNSSLLIEQQQQELLAMLSTTYQTYQTSLSLMELEEKNVEIARENLDITMEKFRIGTIPSIEIRTAQLNYINAQFRYNTAIYEAKISEITLKALTGEIKL